MTPKERKRFYLLVSIKSILAILDLVGILAIGFLATSVALFITKGSDSNRTISLASMEIPAITAQTLPSAVILILGLFLLKALGSILLTKLLAGFLARIEARFAKTVAKLALSTDINHARRLSREEIYFAVQVGSPSAFNWILNYFATIVAEASLFVIVILAFFAISPVSAVAAILYFGIIGLVLHLLVGRWMQTASFKIAEGSISANTSLGDLGEVLRESTIYGKNEFFFNKIYDSRIKVSSSSASQFVLAGVPRYVIETALLVGIAGFVLIQSASGDLVSAAGTVGVFLTGGLRLTASLLPLQSALLSIKTAIPAAERALGLVSEITSTDDSHEETLISEEPIDEVEVVFENLGYKYPKSDSYAVSNMNLKIEHGQQAAFIGPSGAGKSTIADLILGLLTPTSGSVLINGHNPAELIKSSPGLISYVPQKPGMISGSIAENIALGVPVAEIDQAKLQRAITAAHLLEVIAALPEGINSDLGKRKDELSGGQLQRIGLARALYSEPKLLIMDEATSALDANSEHEINKVLDEMRGKVTVILIAHRLNTIQRSDIVYLVENGQITAQGNFAELQRSNPTVQSLAALMAIEAAEK
jgi:ABC-type multidrug transport system fused ATPase/permease subunit